MTGNELIKQLQDLGDEALKLPVLIQMPPSGDCVPIDRVSDDKEIITLEWR